MQTILLLLSMIMVLQLNAQQLELIPTYHSIGIKVTNILNIDSCTVEYKKSNQSVWLKGFNPDKINIAGADQFRGSLFLLEENTSYDVHVKLYNGANVFLLLDGQQFTRISPVFTQTTVVKWVSPTGSGNLYTQANPGNINALFSSGQVTCGTTVLLKDGNYSITDGLALSLDNHCTEFTPILIMAAPGAKPVMDGGQKITTTWTLDTSIPNLYSTRIPSNSAHSSICIMGNTALYPYPSINPEVLLGGYNLAALNFDFDGFVRDENTIWIKTKAGTNPNNESVIVSKSFRFLTVYGNDKKSFLKIKGITFQYFGKPILNPLGSNDDSYSASVLDLRNVQNVYIDSCSFIYNSKHITFSNQCDNHTIQNCNFKFDSGKWSHAMLKKSLFYVHTLFGTISSSRGRAAESAAIFMPTCKQIVIRNNYFDGLNTGIESHVDIGLNEEVDVYNNTFIDNFDAIECDGLWTNLRVWNNEIIRPMAGISAARPFLGPRYFYRNTIHGMKGRANVFDDPNYAGCTPSNNYILQGVGLKTNVAYTGSIPAGNLYLFNNTFHSDDTLGFVFASWASEWRKAIFINNAYSNKVSNPFYYFDLGHTVVNGAFQISSINENYFSYNSTSPIVVAKQIHGEFNCTDIKDVNTLQSILSTISGSPNIIIQNPFQINPSFTNTGIGGFELNSNSPLIDKGIKIDGFYDYKGISPDIGSKESGFPVSVVENLALNIIKIFPNPISDVLNIELSNSDMGCTFRIFNAVGQLVLSSNSDGRILNRIEMQHFSEGIYFLEISLNDSKSIHKFIKLNN